MSFARYTKKNFVEFKAGKATLENKQIISNSEKGNLKFELSEDFILVTWTTREEKGGSEEQQFYSVPGELEFIKVKGCQDGRMYYLKFTSSDQKEFYWLQEPDPSGDAKLEEQIKLIISGEQFDDTIQTAPNAATTTATTSSTATTSQPPSTPVSSNTNLNAGYPSTPSTTTSKPSTSSTATSSTPSSSNPSVNFDLFKDILSSIKPTSRINLSSILTPENLSKVLTEDAKELMDYLPEGGRTKSDLLQTPHTPQFSQAVDQLNHAIAEGHGLEIVQQLGFEPSPSAMRGVEGFLTSIQEGVDKKKPKKSSDDKMDTKDS